MIAKYFYFYFHVLSIVSEKRNIDIHTTIVYMALNYHTLIQEDIRHLHLLAAKNNSSPLYGQTLFV